MNIVRLGMAAILSFFLNQEVMASNESNITSTKTAKVMQSSTVTPYTDGNESISPSSPQTVGYNETASFTVTANPNFNLQAVTGSCPAGSWNGNVYTTGPITTTCSVQFSATIDSLTVTPNGDGNVEFSPNFPVNVDYSNAIDFEVIAKAGYTLQAVTGDCPAGSMVGDQYTTGAITASCSVNFSATANTYNVTTTSDGNETISPSSQTATYGQPLVFNVTANTGYTLNQPSGSCTPGTLSGNQYTTGPIFSECNVVFTATINTYPVTAAGDDHVTVSPATQNIDYGATAQIAVTPATGYSAAIASDSCGGSLVGNTYTTGTITGPCSVSFSSTIDTYTVTASGDDNVTVNPASQTVDYNTTGQVTLNVATGYSAAIANDTCNGTLVGNTYTTGNVTSNCAVSFSSTIDTYTVTASGDDNVTVNPASQTVDYNTTGQITLNVTTGYSAAIANDTCNGTLVGNTYTTGNVTSNCAVSFSSTIDTYTVTASGDDNVTVNPASQTVDYNTTGQVTLNVTTGYSAAIANDTCNGTLVGNTYTTGNVTSNCAVSFSSTIDTYTVTASGDDNVTVNPTSQTVDYNTTGQVTLKVATGYSAAIANDTCNGTLVGNTYTTGNVTSNCAVSFSSTIDTYTVTASGDDNVTVNPASQTVDYNTTGQVTLNVTTGYSAAIANDTCNGTLVGNTYTTGNVTSNCAVSFSSTIDTYTVTASGDDNVTVNPASQTVDYNTTGQVTLKVTTGYSAAIANDTCNGTLVGNTYTTGNVTSNCSVSFSSTIDTYTVTASGDDNVTVNPASQTVDYNTTGQVTLNVTTGYSAAIANDTCNGTLVGNTYTTGNVTSNCAVSFSSTIDTYTVTASGDDNVTVNPASQTVDYNTTGQVTLNVATGYSAAIANDTCNGTLVGNTYTTGNVTSNCAVSFSSTINSYPVTPSGDGNEVFTPDSPQSVNYNGTTSFTVTASTGYTLSQTVGGTCPTGSWSGNSYTTGAITEPCSVSFSATINSYPVTPSGDGNEVFTPNSPQSVNYNGTTSFTVTPTTGYSVDQTVGGTCPAGSWSGNSYTTGAITGPCSVSFSATISSYTVTPSGDNNEVFTPDSPQSVNYNGTTTFTVTANIGYTLSSTVGGTCPAGSWNSDHYTTGAITEPCSVSFSATINSYYVGGTVSGLNIGESISVQNESLHPPVTKELTPSSDTPQPTFTFPEQLSGSAYTITITGSQPDGQNCVFSNGQTSISGTLEGQNAKVDLTCTVNLPYTESFRDPTTQLYWILPKPYTGGAQTANSACLTASTLIPLPGSMALGACTGTDGWYSGSTGPDNQGSGALRLTDTTQDSEEGGIVLQPLFDMSNGLSIQFTAYAYGGTGADGFSFFLLDGTNDNSIPDHLGPYGGGLGYGDAFEFNNEGIKHGFIAIGFDEMGNFSNSGNPAPYGTPIPNSVGIRGPVVYTPGSPPSYSGLALLNVPVKQSSFLYCPGSNPNCTPTIGRQSISDYTLGRNVYRVDIAPGQCSPSLSSKKPKATKDISSGACVTVFINGQAVPTATVSLTPNQNGITTIPDQVYLGYGAATGGNTNIHEISDLTVGNYGSLNTIPVTVTGINDGTLILQNTFKNSLGETIQDNLPLTNTDNGSTNLVMPSSLTNDTSYNITIVEYPDGQNCTISNNSGPINNSFPTVTVSCY
ncbi:hypothetical protein BN59_01465 [Legionella massiliensis]|uniref:Uncharacterized protein n=1 Tax=Legionella massiliensis TaxID=1034943 RepID=A0A078KZJ5_9GAMM|nr:hypothetical protein [Legionella massiliensis]CDZ77183.1 hypothetical protein BN59_01465 [Legionella massiliensis]CEE12921.1 hypothetical protein BN1094_01465 [Legionella massiliensis]